MAQTRKRRKTQTSVITAEALDFAARHILEYYDTDFFPKPFEFEALWFKWGEVKEEILSNDISRISGAPPVCAPWRKPRGGYRIVHQLEPLDALIYTALAYGVATSVEEAREPEESRVACSYRIELADGSFFATGSGFDKYREQCESLASHYPFVLSTDINDFYNQLYLHRLNNALEHAGVRPARIAGVIERFLNRLNSKASQGVPVGPAASIIMAEASLIDVDQFIRNKGFRHVRYVDDFRIFGDSEQALDSLLGELTLYLYENHRLSVSAEKTRINTSDEFLHGELNNQYQLQKLEILEEIEVINPYDMEEVEDHELEPIEDAGGKLLDAAERIRKFEYLDLGVARAIIRRAKAHKLTELVDFIFENFDFLIPIANDVVLYLRKLSDTQFCMKYVERLSALCKAGKFDSYMVRVWMEWYLSEHKEYVLDPVIRQFLYSSPRLIAQARAAVTERNLAWVRERKAKILNYAKWDRRAIIYSAQVLPKDERSHWLNGLQKQVSLEALDRWVVEWVLAGRPKPGQSFNLQFDDDIPF